MEDIENFVKSLPVLTWSGALFPGNVYGASMIQKIEGSLSAFIYGFPWTDTLPSCFDTTSCYACFPEAVQF